MNYYDILKVKPNASKEEIKASYKSLIKKYHPDVYPGDKTFAERKTKSLNTAYDVLSDDKKRAEYDSEIFTPHNCDNPNNNTTQENYYDYYKEDINYTTRSNNYYHSRSNTTSNNKTYQNNNNNYKNNNNNSAYKSGTSDTRYNKVREKVITYTSNLESSQKIWLLVISVFIIIAIIISCLISLISDFSRIFYMTEDEYINNKITEYNNTIPNDNYDYDNYNYNDYNYDDYNYDDYNYDDYNYDNYDYNTYNYDNDDYYNYLDDYYFNSEYYINIIKNYNLSNELLTPNDDIKIREGFTKKQIISLLGEPTEIVENNSYYAWYYDKYIVYFEKENYTVFAVLTPYDYINFMKH